LEQEMKVSIGSAAGLSREARVASAIAVVIALSAICFDLGWRVSGIVLLALATAGAAAFYLLMVRPARIKRDSALTIKIADGLHEEGPRSPLEQLRSRGLPTLFHVRQALEAAAVDPKIGTVIVEVSAPGIGLATAQEIHDLLRTIVAAKKRVIAILSGDSVTVRDYMLACGASEIIVNPDTALMMLGVATGSFFLKDAFAKIGIEAQTLQWKEYKGAAETFTRESMSPELRESLEAIIGDWKTIIAENLAASRNLSVDRARELIGSGFISARSACEMGLVDRTGYIEDLRAEFEPEDKESRLVGLGRYLRHVGYSRGSGRRARLALVHGLGPVVAGDPPAAGEFMGAERVAEEIRRAARDESVRAIVFRINSPGGSAVGSDLVWRAVSEARKRGKPVVASMGDVAGSGGYYVAMAADAIVAEPATITGSIGVVYTKFSMPVLLRQLGIGIDMAKSDVSGDALSLARPMSDTELTQLNQVMSELYDNFTAKVAEGRKLETAAAEAVARGRVWSGIAAKAHGLVDELGGLGRAVEIARTKAGLTSEQPHDLVLYPAPGFLSGLSLTMARTQTPWPLALGAHALGLPERWAPAMLQLVTRSGAMLLCPWI
jgi:protease-4